MFSSRLAWDARPNPLSLLLHSKRAAGTEILDLTESNPTPAGLLAARESVSAYYGGNVDPARIILTASTSEAYGYLFKLLANPGDEILVPRPSYPLFEFLAALEAVRVEQYPLRYDGIWQ